MTALSARSVSLGLVGGVATVAMYWVGLHPWAGLLAWAAFIHGGEDTKAARETIACATFGAALGWVAIMLAVSIPLPQGQEDLLWMPRQGLTVALTLLLAVQATRFPLLARLPVTLLGFAVLFGVDATIKLDLSVVHLLTAPKSYNPLLNGVLSMVGGVLFGLLATRLERALRSR